MIVKSIEELIGNTPLFQFGQFDGRGASIFGKLERFNPGGSVKDRLALAVLNDAESRGEIEPGSTIIECTSGNVGISFAMLAAERGYNFVAVMGDTYSMERRQLLKAYGAQLVLFPGKWGSEGGNQLADRLASKHGWFRPFQFSNPANPWFHQQTTASEILNALSRNRIDAFVAGVGTGGTVTGVARMLKQARPNVQIIAVEPENAAVLSGEEWNVHEIQGLAPNFIPTNLDLSVVDQVLPVSQEDARDASLELASSFGILSGISSGAALAAAKRVAETLPDEANVVTLLPDTGERYLSTYLFEEQVRSSNIDLSNFESVIECVPFASEQLLRRI